jgi:hypothetical protein
MAWDCYAAAMSKRTRIFIAVMLVAVLGGVAWLLQRGPQEPVYEGKPLGYWLRNPKYVPGKVGTNAVVFLTFPNMDSNAVPFLIQMTESEEGGLHRAYTKTWRNMPLWLRKFIPQPASAFEFRRNAVVALGDLRSDAKPAIPALVRLLKGDKNAPMRAEAAFTLDRIGEDDKLVSSALVEALKDNSPMVRNAADLVLQDLDPEATAKAGVTNSAGAPSTN